MPLAYPHLRLRTRKRTKTRPMREEDQYQQVSFTRIKKEQNQGRGHMCGVRGREDARVWEWRKEKEGRLNDSGFGKSVGRTVRFDLQTEGQPIDAKGETVWKKKPVA